MKLDISEEQQDHLYGALVLARVHWTKIQKDLAKVNVEEPHIDDELEINAELRRLINPKAEDEAREQSRRDPAQLDIEEVASSGETGGGHRAGETVTLSLVTPSAPNDEELRDLVLKAGFVVALSDIRGWSVAERAAVESWLGALVAAQTIGGVVPDAPEHFASIALSDAWCDELVGRGPYIVMDRDSSSFEVVHRDTKEVDDTFVDGLDAEVRAARLNKSALVAADMSDDDVTEFAAKGPWAPVSQPDGQWRVECGIQHENAETELDAWRKAARYNKTIAERATADGWVEAPVHLTPDAEQEIKAATEADDDDLWKDDGEDEEEEGGDLSDDSDVVAVEG